VGEYFILPIVKVILQLAPRESPGEIACQWEFKLKAQAWQPFYKMGPKVSLHMNRYS